MNSTFNPDAIRLKHLEERLASQSEMIAKLQELYDVETNPLDAKKLQIQASDLRNKFNEALDEFNALNNRTSAANSPAMQSVSMQLQSMDAKLTAIQTGIETMRQEILARYDAGEQEIIGAILTGLRGEELANTQAILVAIQQNPPPETEVVGTLQQIQTALVELQAQAASSNKPLPESLAKAVRVMEDPKLEFKHKLKVSIPLVPGIVTYEREMALGSNLNLKSAYERLKRLIPHRDNSANP